MRLRQFKRITDAYGANPARWPGAQRHRAQALLEQSTEAQEIVRRAKALDEALSGMTAESNAQIARTESPAAELVRLRAAVMARIGASAHPGTRSIGRTPPTAGLERDLWRRRWIGLTAAASLAVLGGFALGLIYSPAPPQQARVTLLQPAPVQFLVN